MQAKKIKNNFNVKEVIFLIIITCIVSLVMGYNLNNKNFENNNVQKNDIMEEIYENYKYIKENYYEEIDDSTLLKGAIEGMVNSLKDDYSISIDEESSDNFNARLNGSYSGLGVEITNDVNGNIVITEVFDDSPAKRAGIEVLDVIKKIDEQSFENKKTSELTEYIKSSEKEKFIITLLRNNEELTFELVREIVNIKSVINEVKTIDNHKIGYIYISIFAENTAEQFKTSINELESQNIESLIIDVRYNTGGHLTTVVDMLSCLLDSNKVIYQIEEKGKITKYYSKGDITKKYPIVVLQNGESASASELLSSALKEQYGATVIGEKSFGKGTVQKLITLENGIQYKFTTKKWLTSNGTWINEKGVDVDIEVKLNDEYIENPNDENDNQLQEALNYLIKK